jgi:hypothetical protein
MKAEHPISAGGEISQLAEHHKKWQLDQNLKGYDTATALENSALAGFDLLKFRAILLQWVIADNISFRKVASPHLRRLLSYANPRIQMPSHILISRWIARAHDQQLGVVTETLRPAVYVAQRVSQVSTRKRWTQAKLVGDGCIGCPARSLQDHPYKTRSAYRGETLVDNAKRMSQGIRGAWCVVATAGSEDLTPSMGSDPRCTCEQAGSNPGRRDCYVARENGCACRYANRQDRSSGRNAGDVCLKSKQRVTRAG